MIEGALVIQGVISFDLDRQRHVVDGEEHRPFRRHLLDWVSGRALWANSGFL